MNSMNKIAITSAVLVVAFVACAFVLISSDNSDAADTVTQDGITYTLTNRGGDDDNTAEGTSIARFGIPETVTIPKYIEYEGEKYRVTAINATFTAYTSGVKNLVIEENPDLILKSRFLANSYSVETVTIGEGVSLCSNMFMQCNTLTTVTLPESTTEIPASAFQGCAALSSINLGPNVAIIGNSAFASCSSLTSVTLSDALTSIGSNAFRGCSGITELYLGANVKSIGGGAFKGTQIELFAIPASVTELEIGKTCFLDDLDAVVIAKENPAYTVDNGVLYNKDKSVLLYYPRNITTLDGTFTTSASIGPYAFYDTKLTKITVLDGAKSIGEGAFNSAAYLTDISLADSVESIGADAFGSCKALENLKLPASVTEYPDAFFKNCKALKSISLPAGMQRIGENFFNGCSSLETVTMGDNITEIGKNAFSNCTSLKSISLPDSVKTIGGSAFYRLENLQIDKLPASLESVGASAFRGCTLLKVDKFPANLTEIGVGAFVDTGIESITIGEGKTITIPDATKGNCSIVGGSALKSVCLNNVTTDHEPGYGTIVGVSPNLEKYDLGPEFKLWAWDESGLGVNAEKKTAYLFRPGVTKVIIPLTVEKFYGPGFQTNDTVEEIGFEGENTRTITFETSLQTSPSASGSSYGMFRNCTALKKVTLPVTVLVNNEVNLFQRCSSLEEVEIWSIASLPKNTFSNNNEALTKVVLHDCKKIDTAFYRATYVQFPDNLTAVSAGGMMLKGSDGNALANKPASGVVTSELAGKLFVWTGEKGDSANNKFLTALTEDDVLVTVYDGSKAHYTLTAKGSPMDVDKYVIYEYVIDKWYTDPEQTQLYDGAAITEPVTFYPSFDIDQYSVVFDDLEGLLVTESESGRVLQSGDKVDAGTYVLVHVDAIPNAAIGVYFDFLDTGETGGGSSKIGEQNSGKSITFNTKIRVNVQIIDGIKLVFDTTGGTEIEPIEGKAGETYQKPADPTKPGYLFAGWDNELSDVLPENNSWSTKTYTYTAKWCPMILNITFDTAGGNAIGSWKKTYNAMFCDLPVAEREGYTFTGWFDAADGGNEIVYETVVKSTEDFSIYAHWTVNQYTISFDTDGGSAVDSITQDYGTVVAAPASPTKSGLDFLGWDSEIPATMPAGDVTFKALWGKTATADETGAVSVDLRGAEKFSVPEDTKGEIKVALDQGITVVVSDASLLSGKVVTAKVEAIENKSDVEGTAYEFTFAEGDSAYQGKMQITVPYTHVGGEDPVVYYWNGTSSEKMEIVSSTYDTVTFETDHNSVYIVGTEAPEEPMSDMVVYVILGIIVLIDIGLVFFLGRKS